MADREIKGKVGPASKLVGYTVTGDFADLLHDMATGLKEVSLKRPEGKKTDDQALWVAIRNRTEAIGFKRYAEFLNRLLNTGGDKGASASGISATIAGAIGSPTITTRRTDLNLRPTIQGVDAFDLLKVSTEAFLIMESGIVIKTDRNVNTGEHDTSKTKVDVPGENARLDRSVTYEEIEIILRQYIGGSNILPYLKRIIDSLLDGITNEELPYCSEALKHRLSCPSMIELIWSYWLEEGMLVQTMNAITLRFQNRIAGADRDPLAQFEIDSLRSLNNLLWGFIQDEQHRLTVVRRAYEYDHHYGITLYGKAVPKLRSADSRSKFIGGYHNLLYRAAIFYREDADATVISDGFSLLNAMKEVHILLAEGAHNQFGDLPWTARVEMLIMQWLLARPEMREFLRGRAMVPYREDWMGQVDAMKKLQGWTDTTITHFHELAKFGEQLLLSIRYGDWIDINDQEQAKNWARYWKPEIQGYIHAYRAVTGVDLTSEPVDATPPWVHLKRQEDRRLAARL